MHALEDRGAVVLEELEEQVEEGFGRDQRRAESGLGVADSEVKPMRTEYHRQCDHLGCATAAKPPELARGHSACLRRRGEGAALRLFWKSAEIANGECRKHSIVSTRWCCTAPHRIAPHRSELLQPVHYGHFETNGRACSGL